MASTKIYIKDYDPVLLRKKFSNLEAWFRNQETVVELVSPDGLFNIENNKLYKLKPVDKEIVAHDFEGYKLMFDNSHFEKELVFSQIPFDHINIEVVRFYYCQELLGKKTFLRLVIEGFYENTNSIMATSQTKDRYSNFTPTNFYFLTNESFDNVLVKKELNVFLSMLK